MEKETVFFEDLDLLTQEVIIDLFVSIIENKMRRRGKEVEDEASSDLCSIEQGPTQCIL
jgi:hypothetical protein